jgi:hypothetical protein
MSIVGVMYFKDGNKEGKVDRVEVMNMFCDEFLPVGYGYF